MEGVISIITPAYNAGKIIDRAVDAIVPQMDADAEWIIVDDGSTDGSQDVLCSIAATDRRVRLVFHRESRGGGCCTQCGFGYCHRGLGRLCGI